MLFLSLNTSHYVQYKILTILTTMVELSWFKLNNPDWSRSAKELKPLLEFISEVVQAMHFIGKYLGTFCTYT